MKNIKNQLARLLVLITSFFSLGLSTSYAQIGQLGIYGSGPLADRGRIRYVRLENYPAFDGSLNYVLPVNGLTNFNFLYTPDGTGFLPGGGYKVTYLAGDLSVYSYDIVTYSPNSGHKRSRGTSVL